MILTLNLFISQAVGLSIVPVQPLLRSKRTLTSNIIEILESKDLFFRTFTFALELLIVQQIMTIYFTSQTSILKDINFELKPSIYFGRTRSILKVSVILVFFCIFHLLTSQPIGTIKV